MIQRSGRGNGSKGAAWASKKRRECGNGKLRLFVQMAIAAERQGRDVLKLRGDVRGGTKNLVTVAASCCVRRCCFGKPKHKQSGNGS